MTTRPPVLDQEDLAAHLAQMDDWWSERDEIDEALLTPERIAWRAAVMAGQLARLGGNPSAHCHLLRDAGLQQLVVDQLSVSLLAELWSQLRALSSKPDDLKAEASEGMLGAALEDRIKQHAEDWILCRDEFERAVAGIAQQIEPNSSLQVALGNCTSAVGRLDEQVRQAIELLVPCSSLCCDMQQALSQVGSNLDTRFQEQYWWWFEIGNQRGVMAKGSCSEVPTSGVAVRTVSAYELQVLCDKILASPSLYGVYVLAAGSVASSPAHELLNGKILALGDDGSAYVRIELTEDGHALVLVAVDREGCVSEALAGQRVELIDGLNNELAAATFVGMQAVLDLEAEGLALLQRGCLRLRE